MPCWTLYIEFKNLVSHIHNFSGLELQKKFIKEFLTTRESYFNQVQKEKDYENGVNLNTETYNILNLGCKATALTYSMNIKDLHKLFIGRLNPDGNEIEVLFLVNIRSGKYVV
jgi:hypothetical protein